MIKYLIHRGLMYDIKLKSINCYKIENFVTISFFMSLSISFTIFILNVL